MKQICDVWIVDVSDSSVSHRQTKHAVCVSVSGDGFLLINSIHRAMYDDFMIEAKCYPFLKGTDRYVACHAIHHFPAERMERKVGALTVADMTILTEKIRNSRRISGRERNTILPELEKWLLDNS